MLDYLRLTGANASTVRVEGKWLISIDPDTANRHTFFHEWLHRYLGERGWAAGMAVEETIEAFLARHTRLFGRR